MTGEEIQAIWFGPFQWIVYLGVPLLIVIMWWQYSWYKICDTKIKAIIVHNVGAPTVKFAPKGGYIDIQSPDKKSTKIFVVNELSTIRLPYPELGFLPRFLQNKIEVAIFDDNDMEPILNRNKHLSKVASPDVKYALAELADSKNIPQVLRGKIVELSDSLSSAPTREPVASPALLGNLLQERVSQLAVTVSKDLIDPLQEAIKKLGRQLNPTIVYIGMGLIIIMLGYMIMTFVPALEDIGAIKQAIGVK